MKASHEVSDTLTEESALTNEKSAAEEKTAKLLLDSNEIEMPVIVGSENEKGINIAKLRSQSGYITVDEGFVNTGSTYDRSYFCSPACQNLRCSFLSVCTTKF